MLTEGYVPLTLKTFSDPSTRIYKLFWGQTPKRGVNLETCRTSHYAEYLQNMNKPNKIQL